MGPGQVKYTREFADGGDNCEDEDEAGRLRKLTGAMCEKGAGAKQAGVLTLNARRKAPSTRDNLSAQCALADSLLGTK